MSIVPQRLSFDIKEIPTWRDKSSSKIVQELTLDCIRFSGWSETQSLETEWAQWYDCATTHHTRDDNNVTDHPKCLAVTYGHRELLHGSIMENKSAVKDDYYRRIKLCSCTRRYRGSSDDEQKLLTVTIIQELHKRIFPRDN